MVKLEKHYWLDWLRFLAAFIVVITHARGFLFVDWGSVDLDSKNIFSFIFFIITRLGHEAVLVFFVMSGYFVGGRLIVDMKNKTFSARKYFVDRFTRIYLPLFPALIFSLVAMYFTLNEFIFLNFFSNLLMLQGSFSDVYINNGPLWSLAYEWWFYMAIGLFATLIIIDSFKFRLSLFFLLIFSLFIISNLKLQYVIAWGWGGISYVYFRDMKLNGPLVALFLSTCIAASLLLRGKIGFDYYPLIEIFLSLSFSLFIAFSSSYIPENGFSIYLEKFGTRLASFSYTLYLIHYPFFFYLSNVLYPVKFSSITYWSILNLLAVVFSSIFISLIFYYLFERNTQIFRKYIMLKF